tara:strand:+ start:14437 stop:15264 length:828 start_codon:yes stop_codon:yes gene_type:complete
MNIMTKPKLPNIANEINTNGFFHYKNLISDENCNKILSSLSLMKPAINIPYSNIAWGFGNLLEDPNFSCIYNNATIKEICENYLSSDFVFNHLMVNNKVEWIGPGVEWHQEIFNVDTYAPGGNKKPNNWKNFLQVYIALDPHTLENGCLKVVPKSHELGVLPCEDIVNDLLNHKRRIPYDTMVDVNKKYPLKNVIMSPGDILFFNHKFIHGSASNTSDKPRRSIVMQARLPYKRDEEIFAKETKYRSDFVLKTLEKKILKIKSKNAYNDFNKGKK